MIGPNHALHPPGQRPGSTKKKCREALSDGGIYSRICPICRAITAPLMPVSRTMSGTVHGVVGTGRRRLGDCGVSQKPIEIENHKCGHENQRDDGHLPLSHRLSFHGRLWMRVRYPASWQSMLTRPLGNLYQAVEVLIPSFMH